VNTPVKVLFDECVTLPVLDALLVSTGLSSTSTVIEHLLNKFPRGTPDDIWIPAIAEESPIVVTADRGARPSKGGKLPVLCEAFGVTHVVFSGALNQRPGFAKVRAIIDNWEGIIQTSSAPPGSRFNLNIVNSQLFRTKLVLAKEAPGAGEEPLQQRDLF